MKHFFTLLLLLAFKVSAQQIQIVETVSGAGIPFVKVYPNIGSPLLSDIDGYFTPGENWTSVTLKMASFRDTTYFLTGQLKLEMNEAAKALDEVTILPGINPAERIMELAIKNRKDNHPMGKESFKYKSYSKFVFTIDQDALASISDTETDTNLVDLKRFFDQQHLFLLESTTEKSYEPPFRQKEVITAYSVSGFTDPMFSTFTNELQSFNFYENQFDIFGKSYINPLAFGGIRRYLFILEDSIVNAPGDTTFTISFQPRKDKNFEGMKGVMYINSRGYALEKVITEPAEPADGVLPKIIQEYKFVDGKKWFPYKLSTEATFPTLRLSSKLKNGSLIGKGSTYIEDIQLGIDLSDVKFNAVQLQTANDANKKDSTHWDNNRKYSLTEKEKMTYVVIDSISKDQRLDLKLRALKSLLSGKVPLGYFQLDLKRIIDYREYEGVRLGAGLETSPKLSEGFLVGGYFGYGTRDKNWKYGAYGSLMLYKKQFLQLEARYQEDVLERGGTRFEALPFSLAVTSYYDHLYVKNMDRQRMAEVAISGYITPRMKLRLGTDYQRMRLTDGYTYAFADTSMGIRNKFELAEITGEFIWSIGEKVMYIGDKRVSLGSKWPQVMVKVARSYTGLGNAEVDFTRLNVAIEQTVAIRAVGRLSYRISGGKTLGDIPLAFQQVANGTNSTRSSFNISVPNSFETMLPSQFYANEQAAVYTRFLFKPMKLKVKWTTPQFGVHHAMGVGKMTTKSGHSNAVQSMDKGYYEAGLLINRLLVSGVSGIGLGVFYNYGPYSMPQAEKNLTVKLSLSIGLN